jgi:hypothetical protein
VSAQFHYERSASVSIGNIEHVTDMPTKSLQEMQTSMKPLENIEMKDSRTNRTKLVYLILFQN